MDHLHAIARVAACETRLLWRTWTFRLSFGFAAFVLFVYNLLMSAPGVNAPHHFVSLPGGFALGNAKLLNLYLGAVAAFLATEFVKRDRQDDSAETVFVHSFTNLDYVAGKLLGVASLFALLEVLVLAIAAVLHRFFAPAPFSWQPYVLAAVAAALPTLVFTIGLAVLLVTLLRSQAVVLVIMVGLGMLSLTVVGYRFHYILDTFAFHIPLMWSDFVGTGNREQLLLVRGTHLLFGLACMAATPLLSRRLPQSRPANAAAATVAAACLAGAVWTGTTYLEACRADEPYRDLLRQLSRAASGEPAPSVTGYRLEVAPEGRRLRVASELVVRNDTGLRLDTLLFTLNPGLRVEALGAGSQPLAYRREESLLRVAWPGGLAPGDSVGLELAYAGTVDGRACYLDVEEERYEGPYRFWIHTVPKAYAAATPDFLLLTPESGWYPRGGVPPGAAFPAAGQRDYARFEIAVRLRPGMTAFSQGAAEVDSAAGVCRFRPEEPLSQASLTVGRYEVRRLEVDGVTYALAYHPGHAYFDAYLDSVAGALPGLVRELRAQYEAALGLEYPHPRFSLVETPIQFYAYERLWTVAQESVQPELVYLPEMGALCEGADFRRQRHRSRYSQEWANQAETAEALQSDFVRTFATLELLGLQDPGSTDLTMNEFLETRYRILPNFVSYVTHMSSSRWPVLGQAFEAYFRERVAPPENTGARRWVGLTRREEANLQLKGTSLAELLEMPGLERGMREAAIDVKGRQLLQLLAARVGPERFTRELTRLVRDHRYRGLSGEEFTAFAAGLGLDRPEALIEGWYRDARLPGYQIEKAESYLVRDGERTRTQVELTLTNPTAVDGLVEVGFRYRQTVTVPWWLRRGPQADFRRVVSMPAGSRRQVGITVDRPVAELMVDTYASLNLPSLITQSWPEQQLRRGARARTGDELTWMADDPPPAAAVYVVDNEDAGFAVRDSEPPNWLRLLLVQAFRLQERKVPYEGLRVWEAPRSWVPTTDQRFYGRFVLSALYKQAGDGRSSASWRAEIERAGDYDVYFYLGAVDELRGGRRRHGPWRSDNRINLRVEHEGGWEPVELDLSRAEAGWTYLGNFHLAAGAAQVDLTDRATSRAVIADAVKWVERI
ncbi:MAG: hypothetical protein ABIL09_20105 [Gemmatimonadota bacterium]